MKQLCHRCSNAVSLDDGFCPVCGAPQLHFDEAGQSSFAENGDPAQARPGQVQWPVVFGSCARAAVPAGLLCSLPQLSGGSLLWVLAAAAGVIYLYHRKRPLSLLSAKSGFRIGALTGFITAYVSLAATAVLRVIQRYPMHNGADIDSHYEQLIHDSMAIFQASAETQLQTLPFFHYMLTPDGRATHAFMEMGSMTLLTVLLAAIGGMAGVRLFAAKRAA